MLESDCDICTHTFEPDGPVGWAPPTKYGCVESSDGGRSPPCYCLGAAGFARRRPDTDNRTIVGEDSGPGSVSQSGRGTPVMALVS
jgi:hypothetical protein